jgi:hypothetical protein
MTATINEVNNQSRNASTRDPSRTGRETFPCQINAHGIINKITHALFRWGAGTGENALR